MKKKAAVIILVLGLVIAAFGFGYPSAYWKSKNAYSSKQLDDQQQNVGGLILYSNFVDGNEISVHDTVKTIKEMRGSVYIDGVTYINKLHLDLSVHPIGDNYLVEISNGQYFMIPGLEEPKLNEGDSVLVTGQIRTILGVDQSERMAILFVNPTDIEQNNMDNVFFITGIMGVIIMFVGLTIWMVFVFMPEDKGPQYVDIHTEKKKEFLDQVGKKEGGGYPCPQCGINMTFKQEFGKWYCEICNKLM